MEDRGSMCTVIHNSTYIKFGSIKVYYILQSLNFEIIQQFTDLLEWQLHTFNFIYWKIQLLQVNVSTEDANIN